MSNNLRTALIALAAAIVAVIAYSQITSYFEKQHQLVAQRQEIQKSIGENSAAVSELLEFESKNSSATYQEIFDRGGDQLKKLSDALIPIDTSALPDDEKTSLKNYLNGLQEVLRLQIAKYRKQLSASNSLDAAKSASADMVSANYYSYEYAKKRARDALDEATKAVKELQIAQDAFSDQLGSLRRLISTARPKLSDYNLVDDRILAAAIAKNVKTATSHS